MRRHRAVLVAAVAFCVLAVADVRAIEMFTFFGDGSRIGLPSLEVPVEAYPGIPLRSDRLRARRRAARGASRPVRAAQPDSPAGITLRAAPLPSSPAPSWPQPPVAPEPDDVLVPRPR